MSDQPPGICVGQHRQDPERPRSAVEGLLCSGCASRLKSALGELPNLWDALEEVLEGPWREHVVDDRYPLAIAENALPLQPAVAQHRIDIAQQLASWARLTAEEMGQHPPVPDVGRIAQWLADREEWVFAQPWVDDYLHEVVALRGKAKALLDTGRRGYVFLGRCLFITDEHGECQAEVYAPEEAEEATCPVCGILHDVWEMRERLREALRDWKGTITEVADFASSYYGHPIKPATLRKWKHRGHLQEHGHDANGHGLYSVEDVLQVAANYGQKRTG